MLTTVGAPDFSQFITPVLSSGADVLILNHYGGDMVHSLQQAMQFGLRDKMANGKQFEIVVPLISELMAAAPATPSRVSSVRRTGTTSCPTNAPRR